MNDATEDLAVELGVRIIEGLLENRLGKPKEAQEGAERSAALAEIRARLDKLNFVHEDEILGEPV